MGDQADRVPAQRRPTEPASFDEILSRAMEHRGLSLGRIRYHLRRRGHDLSVATLSYWRRGLSRPTRGRSLAAVSALEEILELPVGTLTNALTPRLDPHATGAPGVKELSDRLDLSWTVGMLCVTLHDRIVLDAEGVPVMHHVRHVVEATEEGIRRYPFAFWAEKGAHDLRIEARSGCEVGRSARNAEAVVAEVLLPRPLAVGERWMAEVTMVARGEAGPMTQWGRVLTTPTRVLHYLIDFAPTKVPLNAEAVMTARGVTTRRPLVLRGPALEFHLQDFGPGDVDVCWNW